MKDVQGSYRLARVVDPVRRHGLLLLFALVLGAISGALLALLAGVPVLTGAAVGELIGLFLGAVLLAFASHLKRRASRRPRVISGTPRQPTSAHVSPPVLASIPFDTAPEHYQRVRDRIRAADVGVVAVIAPYRGGSSSTVTRGLANALSQPGKEVAVVYSGVEEARLWEKYRIDDLKGRLRRLSQTHLVLLDVPSPTTSIRQSVVGAADGMVLVTPPLGHPGQDDALVSPRLEEPIGLLRLSRTLACTIWTRPVWLVLAVIAALSWPSPSDNGLSGGVDVTPVDLASVALSAVVFARLMLSLRLNLSPILVRLLGLLVAAGLLSTLGAADTSASLIGVLRYTQLFVVVPLAVALSLRTRQDVALVLVALVILAVGEGALGVYQFVARAGAEYAGVSSRAVGTFGAYNILALSTVVSIGIIVCAAVALVMRGYVRLISAATGLLLLVPLAFSLSRGAWVATAAGVLAVSAAAGWRSVASMLAAAALALLLFAAALPAGGAIMERAETLSRTSSQPDQSLKDRYALWRASLDIWQDHSLTGVGIKNFPLYRDSYASLSLSSGSDISDPTGGYRRVELLSPHNLYLLVLAEQGLLGAFAYGALWLLIGMATIRGLLTCKARQHPRPTPPSVRPGRAVSVNGSDETLDVAIGLVAVGHFCRYSVDALYGDIGGPVSVLDALLLGVLLWWASRRWEATK